MIKNECIKEKVGEAQIHERMTETCLRLFGHVRRPMDSPVRKENLLKEIPFKRVETDLGKLWGNHKKQSQLKWFHGRYGF